MIKKDGNTMIIDTFRDLKSSSAEFNKAKRKTVKLIVKSAEHDQKVIDIINALKEMSDLEWVEIQNPDAVKHIKNFAFFGSCMLEEVKGGSGITDIEDSVFLNCVRLKKFNIGKNMKHIGDRAFANTGLTEINLPDGLKSVGNYAFETIAIGVNKDGSNYAIELNPEDMYEIHIPKSLLKLETARR